MIRRIDPNGIPDEAARYLFDAWLLYLSDLRFGPSQHSSGGTSMPRTITFGSPIENHFSITEEGLAISLTANVGMDEKAILDTVDAALQKVASQDLGGYVVYRTEMTLEEPVFFGDGAIHFMRLLGDQVHVEGARRLSDVVLLDFEEGLLTNPPEGGFLFAPSSKIQVSAFIQGPSHSDFTQRSASTVVELVAAICAFATGRPISYFTPMFPAADEDAATAMARQRDPLILGLARSSVSLDVFGELTSLGGDDAFLRARGSLLAYHAALKQTSPDVATMLLVTSIEALISPRAEWGKSKVTTRFIKSLIQLCPDAVDELLAHANTAEAFGFMKRGSHRQQRRDLLSVIYDTRSLHTHMGLSPSPGGLAVMSAEGSLRVALLSDLARAAILSYLQAPRSSIVGHPGLEAAAASLPARKEQKRVGGE